MKELSFTQKIALKQLNILNRRGIKTLFQGDLKFVIKNLFRILSNTLKGLKIEYETRIKYWYWKYN